MILFNARTLSMHITVIDEASNHIIIDIDFFALNSSHSSVDWINIYLVMERKRYNDCGLENNKMREKQLSELQSQMDSFSLSTYMYI